MSFLKNTCLRYIHGISHRSATSKIKRDKTYRKFLKDNTRLDIWLNRLYFGYDVEKAFVTVRSKVEQHRRKKKRRFQKFTSAIAAVFLLGIGSYAYLEYFTKDRSSDQTIASGTNQAILTLENGAKVQLGKDLKHELKSAVTAHGKLIYKRSNNTLELNAYNTLEVPRGGQYKVELSDDTKIWLNAETKITYPIQFSTSETRQIELHHGEIYIEVSSKDSNENSFKIVSPNQIIEVLGTKFIVNDYSSVGFIKTTLLEGKINIQTATENQVLLPNQQSKIDRSTGDMEILPINAKILKAWVDGYFNFKEHSLEEIMYTLARWYDVSIAFKDENQKKLLFSGILDRSKTLDEILALIQATYPEETSLTYRIDPKKRTVTLE